MGYKIGLGIDVHQLSKDETLKLGGILIPYHKGILAHSDGDIGLHALTDSILGALSLGDIGTFFPSNNNKWKNCDSLIFVQHAIQEMQKNNFKINNKDITILNVFSISRIAEHFCFL